MTKGIRIAWPDARNHVDEIEYFSGIDVDNLDRIPAFSSVPAFWPLYEGGTAVDYNVHASHEPGPDGQVHIVVDYKEADNAEVVARRYDYHPWGTNTIILVPGSREGVCHWLRLDGTKLNDIPWRAFDLAATNARPRGRYLGSRRHAASGAPFSPTTTIAAPSQEKPPHRLLRPRTSSLPDVARTTSPRTASRSGPTCIACSTRACSHSNLMAGLSSTINTLEFRMTTAICYAMHDYVPPPSSGFAKRSCCHSSWNENAPAHEQPVPDACANTAVSTALWRLHS